MGLLCSCAWFTFGVYKQDFPVIIPNGLGILFSIINITCWIIYYQKAKNNPTLQGFLKENDDENAKNKRPTHPIPQWHAISEH